MDNSTWEDWECSDPIKHYQKTNTRVTHNVYLLDEIKTPNQYYKTFNILRQADTFDIIHIHLNTPGGYLDTAIQFVNAIRKCKGRVITEIQAECHSAGTFIFLAGHKHIVPNNCLMMFHNYSGYQYGKAH